MDFNNKKLKFLAVIPARSGSKGIKGKNIRLFGGKSLIAHAIGCAKKSKYINRLIVSTDSNEIAVVSKKYGAEVPFLRPAKLAKDDSPVVESVLHLLSFLGKKENYFPDFLILLQTTSPLRMPEDIDGAIELLLNGGCNAVVTVCATEQLLFIKDEFKRLKLVSKKDFMKTSNRQYLPTTYKLDGSMVYAIKTKEFLKRKSFLKGKLAGYVIPRWRALDLDEPQDFVTGEIIFKKFEQINKLINTFK